MKKHGLLLRLFLGNLLLAGLVAAVVAMFSYGSLNRLYQGQLLERQSALVEAAQRHFQSHWPRPPEEIERTCRLASGSSMRLTVVALDGRVLGDSEADPAAAANHLTPSRPEVVAALSGRPGQDTRQSETLRERFHYLALPIVVDGRVAGAVRVGMPEWAWAGGQDLLLGALPWLGLGAVLVAVLLGLLVTWTWYLPLRQVSRAARQIAAGDLSAPALQLSGSTELGQLARALNELRGGLQGQIGVVAAQRENLQTVLANLREGVIAIDADGRIVVANQAAAALLSDAPSPPPAAELAGKSLQSIVQSLDLLDMCNQVLESPRPVRRQLELDAAEGRRVLEADAAPVGPPDGDADGDDPRGPQPRYIAVGDPIAALLVVRDVTELARAAAMKAEFVASASHELRTPLATLRAAVDSLAQLDAGDAAALQKLAAILDRHVARLEAMTNDLLDLHRVEAGHVPPAREPVDPAALAEWARGLFAHRAAEKNLALELSLAGPQGPPTAGTPGRDAARGDCGSRPLTSDPKLIQLILQNLLDNAVKFTPPGGRVECTIDRRPDALVLRVADTGCGIAPEDQPRVFERFFQADAARSGDGRLRGTGLGLAIVKHAAERLSAAIGLHSELGKGTTMTVTIPIE